MSQLSDLYTNCPSLEVLTDGYTLGSNTAGYTGTIRFWVDSADLDQLFLTVGGLSKSLTIGPNSVTRLIPLIHPYLDPSWNCYADDIRIFTPEGAVAGVDGTGGGITFSDYFIDVHFSTPPYFLELGDYPCCEFDGEPGEDRVTRPGSAYIFPSDGMRLSQAVGVPVKTLDFGITTHRLPAYDLDLYESLIGAVNITTFYGYSAGCVQYVGPKNRGQEIIAGQPVWTVTHMFKFRQIPHNAIMRPDGKDFEAPIEDDGGTPPTPDTTNEEDDANPVYLLAEQELNQLWGF